MLALVTPPPKTTVSNKQTTYSKVVLCCARMGLENRAHGGLGWPAWDLTHNLRIPSQGTDRCLETAWKKYEHPGNLF